VNPDPPATVPTASPSAAPPSRAEGERRERMPIRRASLIIRNRDGDEADPDAAIRRASPSALPRPEDATGDEDRSAGMRVDPRRLAEAAAQWAVTHRVAAGGWRLRYREAGEGPPLVLVHGLGCSTDYWVRNGAWLAAAGFRVLAPDLPGFGRTEGPRAGLSIPKQAYAVSTFAAALGLESAAYLGHSLSCQTVLELACTEPERVRALILAAPTGDRRRKRLVREAVGFLRDIPREPPSLVPLVADAYLRAGPFRWMRTWFAGKRHDAFAAAAGVQAPSAVLIGERDPVVSVHFARAITGAIAGARLVTIPGAAHALIYDEPAGFNAAVVEFLASVLVEQERGNGEEEQGREEPGREE
jgi:2-hydroxy-6-oxonona-2,4-dienedioate hydrolase